MGINEEIQQRQFRSPKQKALINLMYTHNFLINHMNGTFKNFDVTRQQYNVLRILRGAHPTPLTINLIKERMLDKMSDASRIVDRLKAKDLVNRTKSNNDRRAAEIMISEKGLNFLEVAEPAVNELDNLLNNLSGREIETLNELLDKIRVPGS